MSATIDTATWNPTCAGHHFGVWMVEPEWFRSAIAAVRDGLWKAKADAPGLPSNGDARPRPYVVAKGTAVIPIAGAMMKARSKFGGTSTVDVRTQIREAVNDESVNSILVLIDSPGGTVAGTEALAQDVANANKKKPTYAHIEDAGASAAYYVASQARRITASPTSLVGSLGSMMVLDDTTKKNEMAGVKTYLVSSGGMKGAGVDGTEVTPEQLDYFQGIVDSATQHFKNAVMRGRGMTAQAVDALFNGMVFDAAHAKGIGLIDEVVSLDGAFAQVQQDMSDGEDVRINKGRKSSTSIELESITSVLASQDESHKKIAALVNTLASTASIQQTAPEVSTMLAEPSPALSMEISQMANESTQAAPAQNPAPATNSNPQGDTVTALNHQALASASSTGKQLGFSEGVQAEQTRMREILAACPGRPEIAVNAFLAGQNASTVRLIAEAATRAEVHAQQSLQAKEVEIARLNAQIAAGGYVGGVPMAPASSSTSSAPSGLEPAAQAQFEWDSDAATRAKNGGDSCKKRWLLFRSAQLEGRIGVLSRPA